MWLDQSFTLYPSHIIITNIITIVPQLLPVHPLMTVNCFRKLIILTTTDQGRISLQFTLLGMTTPARNDV
jgi:hypothetical protein